MPFLIDISELGVIAGNPLLFLLWFAKKFWYIVVVWGLVYLIPNLWLLYVRSRNDKNRKYTLLAIDIPKDNEQSPKACESIFFQLAGIPSSPSFVDKWRDGLVPESFSLEIVSMGGYIQFLIHTPTVFRDLVEASIYAQYPEAEIVEVEDYALKTRGLKFPNAEYELWGSEYQLGNKECYPIRLYPEFEHQLSQEFKDPMAALMEAMSAIGPDEQIWLQFVITPASSKWTDGADKEISRIVGEEVKDKKNFLDNLSDIPLHLVRSIGDISILLSPQSSKEKDKQDKRLYLSPSERLTVEAISAKSSKQGFYTKARLIYIARKSVYTKNRGVYPIAGALKQFTSIGWNELKVSSRKFMGFEHSLSPKSDLLWFKELRNNARKNKILRMYRSRALLLEPGYYGKVMNTEELATVYHFPIITVKTPFVKRTESKKSEPPVSLPIEPIGLPLDMEEEK